MPLPTDLITPKDAARILKRHISTIHRWIQEGKLRAWQVGSERYQVSERDVRGMIREYRPPELPTPRRRA